MSDHFRRYLEHERFPRSNKYDPMWVFENEMGPNVLWQTEFLTDAMELKPGMRVLDMGCGRALSSIFLAKEFGVRVVANDLWIEPTENWERIVGAGLEDLIIPIKAEAHQLPYAERYFDAALCVDSYVYFGQDSDYARYFSRFVRRGGQIGICNTMLRRSYGDAMAAGIPDYLEKWYAGLDLVYEIPDLKPESINWTLDQWRETIGASDSIKVENAEEMPDACRNHVRFLAEHKAAGFTYRAPDEADDWRRDDGANFTAGRIVGRVL